MNTPAESNGPVIVGLGEVLWDVFPDGPRFGGAPANFACSAAGLAGGAARVCMVSAVGRDELGDRALSEFTQRGVDVACVSRHEKQTGQVMVNVDADGRASYDFAPAQHHVPANDPAVRRGDTNELPANIRRESARRIGPNLCCSNRYALGMLNGLPLASMHKWANGAAAFVCSQPGATPTIPTELQLRQQTR